MTPELELLLCCARSRMDAANRQRARALVEGGVDWTTLLRAAARHGTTGMLYWHLNTACREVVPPRHLEALANAFHATARHNVFASGQLIGVLRMFERHGIPALAYKGPVLASAVYGNSAFRTFHDLDLLVPEREFANASQVLREHGYYEEKAFDWETEFLTGSGGVPIDLHKGIAPKVLRFPLEFEGLWTRQHAVVIVGTAVSTLALADLLIVLCIQAAKDVWTDLAARRAAQHSRLLAICDIAEVVRALDDMEWGSVLRETKRIGAQRSLFLGLRVANDLMGLELPQSLQEQIHGAPAIRRLATHVRTELLRERDGHGPVDDGMLTALRFRWAIQGRWRGIVLASVHLVGSVLTPNVRDHSSLSLPRWLAFLYYVIRPLRIVREFGLRRCCHRARELFRM